MKQNCLNISIFSILVSFLLPVSLKAQKEDKEVKKEKNIEQIIITKKGEGKDKIVVEINGENVTINGKPMDEYVDKNGDVTIRKKQLNDVYELYGIPRKGLSRDGDRYNFRILADNENRAMLGVSTEKTEKGVIVKDVTKESAAEKMGLKEGDIITKIDNEEIADPDDLAKIIRQHKPGDKVKVTYRRDKKVETGTAELTKWKGVDIHEMGDDFKLDLGDMDFEKIMPKIQSIPNLTAPFNKYWNYNDRKPKLGLSVQDSDEGNGVKVIEVDEESNAAKAGIKENDLVTEVDGKAIKGTDDMVNIIRESRDKSSVMIKLKRDGKTMNVEVKMPRKLKTADL